MVIQDKWVFLPPEKKNAAQMEGVRKNLTDIWEILMEKQNITFYPFLSFYRVLEVAELLIKYSVYF